MYTEKALFLIELMIVIAIIGILASVAILSYKNYVLKAKIVEAIVALPQKLNLSLTYCKRNGLRCCNGLQTPVKFYQASAIYQIVLHRYYV